MSSSATCCSIGLWKTASTVASARVSLGLPRTSGGVTAMIVPSSWFGNCFWVDGFIASSMSSAAGSTSYCTSIWRMASSAMCSLSAAMTAIGAPTSKTSSLKRNRVGLAAPRKTSL